MALSLSFAPAAQAQSGDLDRAVAALRAIETMQATFVQTDRNGQRANGTLTLKRPGRIRFQYAPGIPMLIVSDGSALTMIDYQVRQVQRWPIKNSPLGALLDPARDVKKYGTLLGSGDPNWVLVEVRDRSHPEYGVMTFRFQRKAGAPGGLELAGWTTLDSQNKRTAVALSGQRYGIAVPDSMFKYNDPRRPTRR
ncbi:outer membrane lipoprotein carrier protein LolA [Novosphingobium sp. TH158]|uniref:LolA family protein n=1 Tax=Novosphingobium sp. TH158 TaxID=2067455 RepID=UPI0020B14B38|nr:outer membrane lipoprotein carrier protein LolA [Novosphingobium sp. TH158]